MSRNFISSYAGANGTGANDPSAQSIGSQQRFGANSPEANGMIHKAVIGELAEFFTYQQYKRAYSPAARAVIAEQVKSLYEGLDVDDSQAVFDKLNCLPSVLIAKHGERITF